MITISKVNDAEKKLPGDIVANPVGDIIECSSAEELSQKIGFEITDLQKIPFELKSTVYCLYWGELAQIEYNGDGESIIFRKSVGDRDNSGDYNSYENVVDIEIHGATVSLKGNGDLYTLAVWQKNGYAYSLSLSSGMTKQTIISVIEGVK